METKYIVRTTAVTVLAIAGVLALGTLLVRDQISRHRRDLFSAHPLQRLAALSYVSGSPASVDAALLLRDYIAWEPQPLLRKRASAILAQMEDALSVAAFAVKEAY